jgi:hypothetical protein
MVIVTVAADEVISLPIPDTAALRNGGLRALHAGLILPAKASSATRTTISNKQD